MLNPVTGFFNQFALVLLFLIYIMTEVDTEKSLWGHLGAAALEIEDMISHYIGLKTALSMATGVAVAIILVLIQIKLAVLFGIMSFVLNYIPNVGFVLGVKLFKVDGPKRIGHQFSLWRAWRSY